MKTLEKLIAEAIGKKCDYVSPEAKWITNHDGSSMRHVFGYIQNKKRG